MKNTNTKQHNGSVSTVYSDSKATKKIGRVMKKDNLFLPYLYGRLIDSLNGKKVAALRSQAKAEHVITEKHGGSVYFVDAS